MALRRSNTQPPSTTATAADLSTAGSHGGPSGGSGSRVGGGPDVGMFSAGRPGSKTDHRVKKSGNDLGGEPWNLVDKLGEFLSRMLQVDDETSSRSGWSKAIHVDGPTRMLESGERK
ncbi:hypothetical protein N7462_010250 [Penicillium macrosclerotiorum]|uniref:uncharacterized protein n=1 Tax=Penicillium macrosclerotiorum TaxID=303699 RepID=UPI002549BDFF|nr:uncharacterized protein N7462_010250 [Penicillium macrosclerotiorum]KAJ5669180.1 hypothetical protein N7462_010250 [Penicillium macrosclerotiorum]